MLNKTHLILCLFLICLFFVNINIFSSQNNLYKTTTALPRPRQMYGTVVLGDYLYVIGGNIQGKGDDPEGYVMTVEKAQIKPDGALGSWEQTTPLPSNRCYVSNSTLALNDIVYVVMGKDGRKNEPTRTIFWTRPRPNGHLEPWRESLPYPGKGLGFATAVASPGFINVIGGKDAENILQSEVWCARIGSDGSIKGWEQGTAIPIPLYFHCSAIAGGHVWVWGGLKDRRLTRNEQVFVAPILSSGKIGEWSLSASKLPMPFYNAAVTVSGEYILTFCPRYAPQSYTSDIWFAQVAPGGRLSKWNRIQTDIPLKLYTGVASDYRRNYVFIPGGRINPREDERSLDNTVFYFKLAGSRESNTQNDYTLSSTGYHPATGEEHLSYMQQNLNRPVEFPGFHPFVQARLIDQFQFKPLVLYCHTSKAKKCQDQSKILYELDASPFKDRVVFTELNVTKFPQYAQQYGVFKVPCWLFFDASGKEKFKQEGVLSHQQILRLIRLIAP